MTYYVIAYMGRRSRKAYFESREAAQTRVDEIRQRGGPDLQIEECEALPLLPDRERESVVFHVSGFPGWYSSWLDQALDSEIEQDCDYVAREQDSKYYADNPAANYNYPESLKVTESDMSDAYYSQASFCDYRRERNIEWLATLAETLTDECGGRLHLDKESLTSNESRWNAALAALADSLKYESMSSPREYNFTTDRLFAYGRLQAFRVMLRLARRPEYREAWGAFVESRHSSRSGFISHYSNDSTDPESWGRDIGEYDHNQLATLFAFALDSCEMFATRRLGRRADSAWDDINDSICDAMLNGEDSAFYQHVQLGDSAIAEIRGRKLCEWIEGERLNYSGAWESDCEALKWLAGNPDSDIVKAAREHDGDLIKAALEFIARDSEAFPPRCEKTPDMFAADTLSPAALVAAVGEAIALNGPESDQ
jgi:hypothetical protein